MSSKRAMGYWNRGAAIAGTVIVAVAALLIAIIATGQSIRANAQHIYDLACEIASSTKPIWKLADLDSATGRLLLDVRTVAKHSSEIAVSLEERQEAAAEREG